MEKKCLINKKLKLIPKHVKKMMENNETDWQKHYVKYQKSNEEYKNKRRIREKKDKVLNKKFYRVQDYLYRQTSIMPPIKDVKQNFTYYKNLKNKLIKHNSNHIIEK